MSSSTLRERPAEPYSRAAVKDLFRAADVDEVAQTTGTAARARCSRCSAAVRPGAPWCTQCYTPTVLAAPDPVPRQSPVPQQSPVPRQSPVAAAEPVVPVAAAAEAAVTAAAPAPRTGLPTGTWPCSTCSHANALALADCEGCGTPFLAAARDDPPSIVLPVVGDLLELSPARRTGLAVGVVLALVLVSALVALLLA